MNLALLLIVVVLLVVEIIVSKATAKKREAMERLRFEKRLSEAGLTKEIIEAVKATYEVSIN